jgi:hypothetical protein
LVSHLQDPLGRHVGTASSLLALANDAFQNVDNLLVELADAELVSVLVLCFFASLLLQYVLYLTGHSILEQLIGQPLHEYLCGCQEVLLDKVEQIFDLLNLQVGWLENVRGASIVIHNCDREDFKRHLMAKISSQFVVFYRFLEFGYGVVILVGELPPIGAELADVIDLLHLQAVDERLQLVVNLGQVIKVKLDAAVELHSGIGVTCSASLIAIVLSTLVPACSNNLRHAGATLAALLIVVFLHLLVSLLVEDLLFLVDQIQVIRDILHQRFGMMVIGTLM